MPLKGSPTLAKNDTKVHVSDAIKLGNFWFALFINGLTFNVIIAPITIAPCQKVNQLETFTTPMNFFRVEKSIDRF